MNKLYEISLNAKSQITEVPITKETKLLLHIGRNTDCRGTIRKDELMTPVGKYGIKTVFCYEEHLNEGIDILLDYESDKLKQLRERIAKQEENMEKLRSKRTLQSHAECVQLDDRTGGTGFAIKSEYEHKIKSGVLVIYDLGLGDKSVVYNMENVLREIKNSGTWLDGIPIVCKVSDGIFDIVEPGKGSFRFISLKTTDEDEAIQGIKERGIIFPLCFSKIK